MKKLAQHIESLIFVADSPIKFNDIQSVLEELFDAKVNKKDIDQAIDYIKTRYNSDESAIELVEIAGGYQFLTKGAFHHTVGILLKQNSKKKLSTAALETLSIVAYKQPTTKTEVEAIRGVSCDYAMQKLLEKELIAMVGRAETPGRPLLYATSEKFMDYFGLKDLSELPKPKEFKVHENMVGTPEKEEDIQFIEVKKSFPDTIIVADYGYYDMSDIPQIPTKEEEFHDTIIIADFGY
ncbi:MAG TPA: SMC-Scp complex subunit ScpB [Saprospiraceae bacterium]|nr:SMC-Scp complex subunit ScpB [Saprospiraceae bacterium]